MNGKGEDNFKSVIDEMSGSMLALRLSRCSALFESGSLPLIIIKPDSKRSYWNGKTGFIKNWPYRH